MGTGLIFVKNADIVVVNLSKAGICKKAVIYFCFTVPVNTHCFALDLSEFAHGDYAVGSLFFRGMGTENIVADIDDAFLAFRCIKRGRLCFVPVLAAVKRN